MRIYNYLFYKSYQLAIKSRNFDEMPVLGGITFLGLCLMFNFFTIVLTLEGFGLAEFTFDKKYKFLFALALVLIILFYYHQGDRYKRIIEHYNKIETRKGIGLHPILVIALYYLSSFGLLLLAGLFKNGDWIFSK